MQLSILALVASLSATVYGKVIDVTDSDIDEYINNGVPTLLSIHAPWCGHCKTFAPQFEELSEKYEHAKSKIQFLRIDGDANRKTSKKYNVEYFPTLKFVEGSKQEAVERRDLSSLENLIKSKTGAVSKEIASAAGTARNYVASLTDSNFSKKLENKHGLVAFSTTWCGHCKKLKPTWDSLAKIYANDKDMVIGSVDCTEQAAQALQKKYGITGFPTIMYFPKDGSEPTTFNGARKLSEFTQYLKDNGASEREHTGFLSNSAGLIKNLTSSSSKIIDATEEQVTEYVSQVEASGSEFAAQYLKYIPKVREGGVAYIKKERKRLSKLIKGNVSHATRDNIKIRMNILRSFLPSLDDSDVDSKDEL